MIERGLGPVSTWIRLVVGFAAMALAAIVLLLVDLVLVPSRRLRIHAGNLYGKVIGRLAVWLAGTKVHTRHGERLAHSRPAIYVTNHTSALDIFLGMWLCPMGGCGVAKKEIARIPFFGWAYKLSGHLLIDRADRDNAIAALRKIADVVQQHGLSIWIWPEGTRSPDGRLRPFKKGFVHLALATGLPIVPVVVHGAHERWVARTRKLVPGEVDVDVLEPVSTAGWKPETVDQHVEQVRGIFLEHLRPTQRPADQLAS